MNIKTKPIDVNGISIDVIRKDIKNMHLSVHPPTGRVRISAPLNISEDAIRLFAVKKISWINKHKSNFLEQERQTQRDYVNGESHYFLGKRYLLDVIYQEGKVYISINPPTTLRLFTSQNSSREDRERVMTAWYRKELKERIPTLIEEWEEVVGVKIDDWRVRKMKTKWGSCNEEAKRIWLNLELIKKPIHCLEYIIVHEMVHLLVRHHDEEFISKMDEIMPKWRLFKDELNTLPLAYAEWEK